MEKRTTQESYIIKAVCICYFFHTWARRTPEILTTALASNALQVVANKLKSSTAPTSPLSPTSLSYPSLLLTTSSTILFMAYIDTALLLLLHPLLLDPHFSVRTGLLLPILLILLPQLLM